LIVVKLWLAFQYEKQKMLARSVRLAKLKKSAGKQQESLTLALLFANRLLGSQKGKRVKCIGRGPGARWTKIGLSKRG
jgi:hypothetical protein